MLNLRRGGLAAAAGMGGVIWSSVPERCAFLFGGIAGATPARAGVAPPPLPPWREAESYLFTPPADSYLCWRRIAAGGWGRGGGGRQHLRDECEHRADVLAHTAQLGRRRGLVGRRPHLRRGGDGGPALAGGRRDGFVDGRPRRGLHGGGDFQAACRCTGARCCFAAASGRWVRSHTTEGRWRSLCSLGGDDIGGDCDARRWCGGLRPISASCWAAACGCCGNGRLAEGK